MLYKMLHGEVLSFVKFHFFLMFEIKVVLSKSMSPNLQKQSKSEPGVGWVGGLIEK